MTAALHRHHRRLLAVACIASLALTATACQAERDAEGDIVGAGTLAADELGVGDCFDDGAATEEVVEIADVPAVPCDEPHDNEVFHAFELEGDELPADAEIEARVDQECVPAFDLFVGTAYETSELDLFAIWPTAGSWDGGDREVLCAVYAMDQSKLEGTVAGSGR
jgi:hypothetical protein